ncbi:MAG: radical SAM protein [Bacteroidales bacterium]|jgi:uncharacterized protein|nr:radical SAM protein [Bacteroidales bacterium]
MKHKLSNYIHIKEKDDVILIYTMMNDAYFALSKDKYDLLLQDNVDKIKEQNTNFFSAMKKLGVLIPSDLNEIESVQMNNRKQVFNNNHYKLTINPTLECNFRCWYCYEEHPKGYMSKDTMRSIVKYVERMINEDGIKHINLDWFGGEPLLYYDEVVFPLSKKIMNIAKKNNVGFSNGATTNGYMMNEKKISSFVTISLNNFQITLDGNKELHDKIRYNEKKGGSYEQIIENLRMLSIRENVTIQLRINYTQKTLEKITEILDDLPEPNSTKGKIQIMFQQVWQDSLKKNVSSDNVQDVFRKKGFSVNGAHINPNFYTCYADCYYQSVINYNGDIFKCTARDFYTYQPDGKLDKNGEIVWNESILSKRLGKATFENEKCLSCNYLPACTGPCSQKVVELSSFDKFDRICNKEGIISTINQSFDRFYEKLNMNTL